jgi:hypothetical protein
LLRCNVQVVVPSQSESFVHLGFPVAVLALWLGIYVFFVK